VLFGDVADFVGGRDQAPTRPVVTLDRASPDFDRLWRFVGLSTMDHAEFWLEAPVTTPVTIGIDSVERSCEHVPPPARRRP
jgi:hypothetical protein